MAAPVVIGVDPDKRSNTVLVLDAGENVLARQRFSNDRDGFLALRRFAEAWAERIWAVEGARGVGLRLAQRLAAEGETVLNVPAHLSARVRALGGGSGRKTDDTDAFAIAVAGLRGRRLQRVVVDDGATVLKLLSDRRNSSLPNASPRSTGSSRCWPNCCQVQAIRSTSRTRTISRSVISLRTPPRARILIPARSSTDLIPDWLQSHRFDKAMIPAPARYAAAISSTGNGSPGHRPGDWVVSLRCPTISTVRPECSGDDVLGLSAPTQLPYQ